MLSEIGVCLFFHRRHLLPVCSPHAETFLPRLQLLKPQTRRFVLSAGRNANRGRPSKLQVIVSKHKVSRTNMQPWTMVEGKGRRSQLPSLLAAGLGTKPWKRDQILPDPQTGVPILPGQFLAIETLTS